MSYRARQSLARNAPALGPDVRGVFRQVFSSPEGERVLHHILTRICRVDAIVPVPNELEAVRALERKNVGLEIAQLVFAESDQPKVTT